MRLIPEYLFERLQQDRQPKDVDFGDTASHLQIQLPENIANILKDETKAIEERVRLFNQYIVRQITNKGDDDDDVHHHQRKVEPRPANGDDEDDEAGKKRQDEALAQKRTFLKKSDRNQQQQQLLLKHGHQQQLHRSNDQKRARSEKNTSASSIANANSLTAADIIRQNLIEQRKYKLLHRNNRPRLDRSNQSGKTPSTTPPKRITSTPPPPTSFIAKQANDMGKGGKQEEEDNDDDDDDEEYDTAEDEDSSIDYKSKQSNTSKEADRPPSAHQSVQPVETGALLSHAADVNHQQHHSNTQSHAIDPKYISSSSSKQQMRDADDGDDGIADQDLYHKAAAAAAAAPLLTKTAAASLDNSKSFIAAEQQAKEADDSELQLQQQQAKRSSPLQPPPPPPHTSAALATSLRVSLREAIYQLLLEFFTVDSSDNSLTFRDDGITKLRGSDSAKIINFLCPLKNIHPAKKPSGFAAVVEILRLRNLFNPELFPNNSLPTIFREYAKKPTAFRTRVTEWNKTLKQSRKIEDILSRQQPQLEQQGSGHREGGGGGFDYIIDSSDDGPSLNGRGSKRWTAFS